MRLLLDNCVPRRLAGKIHGHEVATAVDVGWADLTNGRLLDAMAGKFDVLVTVDTGIPFQERLSDRPFAVALLRAHSNRLADLLPLMPALLLALTDLRASCAKSRREAVLNIERLTAARLGPTFPRDGRCCRSWALGRG